MLSGMSLVSQDTTVMHCHMYVCMCVYVLHVEWYVTTVARHYCHALSASPQGDAVRLSSQMCLCVYMCVSRDITVMHCHMYVCMYVCVCVNIILSLCVCVCVLHVEWYVTGVARHYCHALSASPQGDAVRLSSGMAHSGFEV
jgi:hypothetical protein